MVNNLGGYHELDSIKSQIISSFDNDFDRTIDLYEDHIGNKISKGLVSGDLGLDESIELEDKLNELKSIRSSMNFDRLKELVNDEGGVLNIIEVSAYNKLIVNEHFDNNRSIDSKNNIEESLTAKDIFEKIGRASCRERV